MSEETHTGLHVLEEDSKSALDDIAAIHSFLVPTEGSRKPQARRAVEQLRLVHSELDRQLQENMSRQSNMLTRSSILFASAGVLAVLPAPLSSPWNWLPLLLSIGAALFGFGGVWPWPSRGSTMTKSLSEVYLKSSPFDVEHRLVADAQLSLDAANRDLRIKSAWVRIGLLLLVAALAATLVVLVA